MEESRNHVATSSFTHNGDYFALLSVDGRLRIWDTSSGKVVQEFSSNSVTQSSCTCVCWTRRVLSQGEKKKLKRKHKKIEKSGNGDITLFPSLAIGTEKGFLFCYNPTTGETEKLNKDGHIDKVNCVTYHEKQDILYTCSDDKYIAEWFAKDHQIKSKWKADKRAVKRICIGPSGTTLLSAGCSIKLWNLDTKELLQQFNGHSSPISMLQFSPYQKSVEGGIGDDGYYFVSGSTTDRVINAWQVNTKNRESMAVASFVISDVPVFMDIILDEDDDQPLKLSVGCKDGRIHFFTCMMNGRTLKPIESSKTLDYLQKDGASTSPVPFVNGRLYKSNDVNLNLVHGQILDLSFTSLCYGELDITSTIEKDVTKNLLLRKLVSENDTSIEFAATDCSSKFISDTSSSILPAKVNGKKNTSNIVVGMNGDLQEMEIPDDELSMEERIKVSQSESKEFVMKMKPNKAAPNAGSFAQMLIQALHSNDRKLICEMLYKNKFPPKVLMNTLKRVPNNLVETLLRTIIDLLLLNTNRSSYLISWLRTIMSVHLTFLLTSEMARDALAGLYRLVKAQEEIHMPLQNLQGKIDMVCSYVSGNVESDDEEDLSMAAVTYDDSSDEMDESWKKDKKPEKEIKEIEDSDMSDVEAADAIGDTGTDINIDMDGTLSEHSESEEEV